MDSDSYESALSSAESEYAPKKKTAAAKGKKKKVDVPYKAKHSLKAPRATTYTAQSLVGACVFGPWGWWANEEGR